MASSYVAIRVDILDCFEAVTNQTQCRGMSLWLASSMKCNIITAELNHVHFPLVVAMLAAWQHNGKKKFLVDLSATMKFMSQSHFVQLILRGHLKRQSS